MSEKRMRGFLGTLGCLVGRAPREEFWEPRFNELATYNSEVARGLCYTPEWKQRMAQMQADYNAEAHGRAVARTVQPLVGSLDGAE